MSAHHPGDARLAPGHHRRAQPGELDRREVVAQQEVEHGVEEAHRVDRRCLAVEALRQLERAAGAEVHRELEVDPA